MAFRDYIICRECKCKYIYDGSDHLRDAIEEKWGDPEAPNWTVPAPLCPDCDKKREAEIAALKAELDRVREERRWIPPKEQIEVVTKAILFEDCGNTEDWADNINLGRAAISAYRPYVQSWRNDAIEAAAKIASDQGYSLCADDIRGLIHPLPPHPEITGQPVPEE